MEAKITCGKCFHKTLFRLELSRSFIPKKGDLNTFKHFTRQMLEAKDDPFTQLIEP